MLGLHQTWDVGLTYDQKMAKLAFTRELVGKVVYSSYVTHQNVINYSIILAKTRAYSPLRPTSSTTAFNRQKRSWNLSISLASDPTHSWIILWSLQGGRNSFTRWPRMSFDPVVKRSQVTLEIFVSCELLPSHTGNSRRSRPGRRSVVKHPRSVGGWSQVNHGGRVVVVVLRPEIMPIDLRMACEGRQLASLWWSGRKSFL